MAREARKKSSTGIYHILIRTKDRLFLDDGDRKQFCLLLEKYFSEDAVLYGIRISEKKIHLIADEKGGDIAKTIKPFCTSYARYYNRVHSVNGKLFEDRFKSEPIETDEKLLSVAAYLYRDRAEDYGTESYVTKNRKINLKKAKLIPVMDDYENMPVAELSDVIDYILSDCGKMTKPEKLAAAAEADIDGRLRIGLIKKALGIKDSTKTAALKKKNVTKNPKAVEKTEENKQDSPNSTQKKKELSVWLL